MSQFAESLARLYQDNQIDERKIKELFTTKKINQQEYDSIISAKKAV